MNISTVQIFANIARSKLDRLKVALSAVLAGLIGYAYFGQPVEGTMSAYEWLTGHWRNISHYSHGPLIPLIALGIAWWKRHAILAAIGAPSAWGQALVAWAMLLYYAGVKAVQPRVVVISFVVMLYGLALGLGGRRFAGQLLYPIAFLLLMVPLNFVEERIGVPLRHIVAYVSTQLLNFMGVEAVRVGTGIHTSVFNADVANPCSGIQSLMALTTVTAAYGYVTQASQWKRWVLFLSAGPLAVLGNIVRVTSIVVVAQVYGADAATEYHDWSGYVVFGVALSAMVGVGALLSFPYAEVWRRWTQRVAPTSSPA